MMIQKRHVKSRNNVHSARLLGCLIAGCVFVPVTMAADNPDAHEHGRAQLQMALENTQIDLMFTSPAYNLAGFEHEARTDEQKKQLADIQRWLETTPLVNTEAGTCVVAAATVQLGEESESHHEAVHDDHPTHSDYEITQQLACDGMTANDAFTTPLPARFAQLEELAIEWVGPTGQGSTVIDQPGPRFKLTR